MCTVSASAIKPKCLPSIPIALSSKPSALKSTFISEVPHAAESLSLLLVVLIRSVRLNKKAVEFFIFYLRFLNCVINL